MTALAISMCAASARATDGTHDFARYRVILERAPFGAMAGVASDAAQPGFSARFSFVGFEKLSDEEPLTAIIWDKEANRAHFKSEGETIGPVTVVKIEKPDKGPAKVVLQQQLEVATLLMDSKAASGGPAPALPPPSQPGQPPIPGAPQTGARRIPFARGVTK